MLDFGGQTLKTYKKHDVFLQQSNFMLFCVTQITKIGGGNSSTITRLRKKVHPLWALVKAFGPPRALTSLRKERSAFCRKFQFF